MMAYEAKIILDSVGPNGARLTTFELTYPRFVHAELMTHRMFSRNSASSRAIPNEKLRARVQEDPAMPVYWGENQRGMQAGGELRAIYRHDAEIVWRSARDEMLRRSAQLADIGLHKQLCNRLIEPWMFITVVITATEWDNAWGLRVDPAAQPEMERAFHLAKDLYDRSVPQKLAAGAWHLPYVTGYDEEQIRQEYAGVEDFDGLLCRVSIGRCAAVSFLNQDKRDPPADLARAGKMTDNGHMSPFEHVAQALTWAEWGEYATKAAHAWLHDRVPVGNLWGWKQYRKTLSNEHDYSKIKAAR
jgi:hypothetical protein